ncbi:tautomerase [Klebsiella pneumoniae]|nr:tautomerase [Klebsiella pneumoniae]
MAHDVPLGCAPDEYDDLISGTCSHLPYYFVLFHIFAGKPRSRAQKQGLYRRLCARLDDEMAVSPQDVMVVIQFNQLEDWSFSAGKMADE